MLSDTPQQAQGAIIMCLHRARTLGYLQSSAVETEGDSLWLGYLSTEVLKETLCSMDDHVSYLDFTLTDKYCTGNRESLK